MAYPPDGGAPYNYGQDIRDLRESIRSLERTTDTRVDVALNSLADINTKIALLNSDRQHHDQWHTQQNTGKDKREGWYVAIAISVFANIIGLVTILVGH